MSELIIEMARKGRICAHVTHISQTGLSRRIKYFGINNNKLIPITHVIADELKINCNDRGLIARGAGIDVCFHTLYTYLRNFINTQEALDLAANYTKI